MYYQAGESYVRPNCSGSCTCPAPGQKAECEDGGCGENEVCSNVDGVDVCECANGTSRIGDTCKGEPLSIPLHDNSLANFCAIFLAKANPE